MRRRAGRPRVLATVAGVLDTARLAWMLLRERRGRLQLVGVPAALAAVAPLAR